MCGVLGYAGPGSAEKVGKLIRELNIRGQHASGFSIVEDGQIKTKKFAKPAAVMAGLIDPSWLNSGALVGHCRYSTSSLEYNQPISTSEISVVHNGVISQEEPALWESLFGYACTGENDSELLMHCMLAEADPFLKFPEASIAACVLTKDRFRFFRNGKRPLWFLQENQEVLVASTRDSIKRSLGKDPEMCAPFTIYDWDFKTKQVRVAPPTTRGEDLQDVRF